MIGIKQFKHSEDKSTEIMTLIRCVEEMTTLRSPLQCARREIATIEKALAEYTNFAEEAVLRITDLYEEEKA